MNEATIMVYNHGHFQCLVGKYSKLSLSSCHGNKIMPGYYNKKKIFLA